MPKIIELTLELEVHKVSCPGVWLCQDGCVSLTVFALGTSYQSCLLPPIFPLVFKDIFYFRKRFQEACALNNICCMLKDETIYCELVQWCQNCMAGDCIILAQYLGALNDVLFPPHLCCNDGVDLLMRRSKDYPGILSPKIEISTKLRIDEVWDSQQDGAVKSHYAKVKACSCKRPEEFAPKTKPVCHTPMYHRVKCSKKHPSVTRLRSRSRSHSRSRSNDSLSFSSLSNRDADCFVADTVKQNCDEKYSWKNEEKHTRAIESMFINHNRHPCCKYKETVLNRNPTYKVKPCICDICKRYHELFHANHVTT